MDPKVSAWENIDLLSEFFFRALRVVFLATLAVKARFRPEAQKNIRSGVHISRSPDQGPTANDSLYGVQ